jgi:lambda family phage portal protein
MAGLLDWLRRPTASADRFVDPTGAPFRATTDSSFEAARRDRRLKAFTPSRDHVNQAIAKSGGTLVARARHLVRNNGYASNAVDAFASHAVGTGVRVNPSKVVKGETRDNLLSAWRIWCEQADADGLTDFYGIQRRVAREHFIAGECFVRLRARRPEDGLIVPLQLQVLPAEMLDMADNKDLGGGRAIRNGIEFDAIGRRVAYHFYKIHPGDFATVQQGGQGEKVRVPAEEVLHVYEPTEAGQVRGVSKFAAAIVKLFMLDAYDDAELERKKTAALFVGFVKRLGEGDPFAQGDEEEGDADGNALLPLEPGLMQYLDDNEDVTFSQPTDVGGSYDVFQYRTLLQISSAIGVPYPYLTGDNAKANYSNTRAGLLDFRRRTEAFQWNVLVFMLCRPVWLRWLRLAHVNGALSLPSFARREAEYAYAEWLPPRWDWVDPLKDTQAEILAISAGLKSRSQSISERGYDPEQVDQEIKADHDRQAAMGLSFRTDAVNRMADPRGNEEGSAPGGGASNDNSSSEEDAA